MNALLDKLSTVLIPALTIAGLIVLLALNKIDQTAGIGLIAALSGAHAGATYANSSSAPAQPAPALAPEPQPPNPPPSAPPAA